MTLRSTQLVFNTFDTPFSEGMDSLDYLQQKYIKNKKYQASSSSEITARLAKLPPPLLTYFFVEILLQSKENGCLAYDERQPGSIQNVFSAWCDHLKRNRKTELDAPMIKTIHKAITQTTEMDELEADEKGEFRQTFVTVVISKSGFTKEGMTDLLDKIESQKLGNLSLINFDDFKFYNQELSRFPTFRKEFLDLKKELQEYSQQLQSLTDSPENSEEKEKLNNLIHNKTLQLKEVGGKLNELKLLADEFKEKFITGTWLHQIKDKDKFASNVKVADYLLNSDAETFCICATDVSLDNLMQIAIANYQTGLEKLAKASVDEKLYFFMKSMKDFLLLHPFSDANLRTFLTILFTDMIHHQLYPPVFFNPFVFFSLDVPQLVDACKFGMASTLAMIDAVEHGNELFDFNLSGYTPSDLQQIEKWVSPLSAYLRILHPDVEQQSIPNDLIAAKVLIIDRLMMLAEVEAVTSTSTSATLFNTKKATFPEFYKDLADTIANTDNASDIFTLLKSKEKEVSSMAPLHADMYADMLKNAERLYHAVKPVKSNLTFG